MGKTPERHASSLRYRRKVPDNQQPEPPVDAKSEPPPKQLKPQRSSSSSSNSNSNRSRSSRSPAGRRFRPKPRQSKQQPPLLKQLLWKAKAVQPTPAPQSSQEQEQEEEEVAFATEQRQTRKLLASEAEAQNRSKTLALEPSAESSQETQSGSEDEAAFLPYNDLPTAKWHVYKQQETEEMASPLTPSNTAKDQQDEFHVEKAAATRRKQRQKYKLKQKQKRAAAKEQKRLQHQQKQLQDENEEDAGPTQDDEDETMDIFHPPTNLASEMDAGVCRAVLSQLKDVVPFIVVGDVACPVVAEHDEHSASASDKSQVSAPGSHVAVVDFRQHVIAMLDRSKETQMQYRESFVVEGSGFDAASSYDFFKRRFCEIQRSADIVYY
ncbi:hypothetical protein KRP22_001577 [Phytophthora ramorum]|nr:hypothetical protein KRP22_858 [Phytophthora ramorum]